MINKNRVEAVMANQDIETKTDTTTHWQRFAVPFEFPVCFTENLFDLKNTTLVDVLARLEPKKTHKALIFLDDGLSQAYPNLITDIAAYVSHQKGSIELVTPPIVIPGGEKIKSDIHFVEQMQQTLYDFRIDRHSYVIAIGGGAVLDAVGLVCATTHRGVRHVRIPTTVLSQNDSGVGVKNGINLYGAKNYIGTFAPPFAVLNDISFVMDLGERDKIAGMAEAVKVALIRNAEFFGWLEKNADALATFKKDAMATLIRRCAELHMHQIGNGGDPFEMGSARPLDYGHWAAHKLEGLTRYHLRHGEAVAIGIALDARYSVLTGLLNTGEEDRICFLLEHLGFKLWHAALEKRTSEGELELMIGLQEFREHLGGELTITLLSDIGVGVEVHEMDTELVLQSIQWLKERQEV
jgi:3-dehydroquinate synthase